MRLAIVQSSTTECLAILNVSHFPIETHYAAAKC